MPCSQCHGLCSNANIVMGASIKPGTESIAIGQWKEPCTSKRKKDNNLRYFTEAMQATNGSHLCSCLAGMGTWSNLYTKHQIRIFSVLPSCGLHVLNTSLRNEWLPYMHCNNHYLWLHFYLYRSSRWFSIVLAASTCPRDNHAVGIYKTIKWYPLVNEYDSTIANIRMQPIHMHALPNIYEPPTAPLAVDV